MAWFFLVIYISTWQSCSLFPNTRMYPTWYPHKSVLNPDAGSGVPDFQGRFPSLNGLKKHPQGDHWLQHCWQRYRSAFFGPGEADQKSHSYGIDGPFTDALPMMTFRSFHRFLHGGAPKPYVWWFLEPNSCSSTCTHTHIYIYICTHISICTLNHKIQLMNLTNLQSCSSYRLGGPPCGHTHTHETNIRIC